jgi:hypothetical protein
MRSCRYPHVCAKHIIGDESCDENTCTKNHNLVTDQSREILADLGFIADGNYNSLLQAYSEKCRTKLNATPHDIQEYLIWISFPVIGKNDVIWLICIDLENLKKTFCLFIQPFLSSFMT